MCVLGNRLLQMEGSGNCTKTPGSALYKEFCKAKNEVDGQVCDEYFQKHEPRMVQGIKGLSSGTFFTNLKPWFMEKVG